MEKNQKPPGGQVGMRGYLVQTLIALLDVVLVDPPFETLTLEPGHESEQFDLVWKDSLGRHAMQVKSTVGQFAVAEVKRWAAELEGSGPADEYRLRLVGLHSASLAKEPRIGRVVLDKKNLDLKGFRVESAHGLDRFLRAEGLNPGSPDDREMLADALAGRLAAYSTTGTPLSRPELVNLLKSWIAQTPTKLPKNVPSRLPRGAQKLFGRKEDLERIDQAWGDTKTHILVMVGWGGVGKTALVVEWMACKARDGWPGFECVFDWSFYHQGTSEQSASSADLFIAAALEFFGDDALARSAASPWEKGARLAQLVGQQRSLLVLDGLEPLQHPPGPLAGQLHDPALVALLRGLAANNLGLCIVTTRESATDLDSWMGKTVLYLGERERNDDKYPQLSKLSTTAGVALLKSLGVRGIEAEYQKLVEEVHGHALTLNLLGRYLANAHKGDIRRRDQVRIENANEKIQGGHAFRVMAAYETWLVPKESLCRRLLNRFSAKKRKARLNGKRQLAILRLLGLFDRPATLDCLAALRAKGIVGLTEAFPIDKEEDWNESVSELVKLNLLEEQSWEPRRILGYTEDAATKAMKTRQQNQPFTLGEPMPFETNEQAFRTRHALDAHTAHPRLLRGPIGERPLRDLEEGALLFVRLLADLRTLLAEGLDGLQPLYEAVAHGCQAGRHPEALNSVYTVRVARWDPDSGGDGWHYSARGLGAWSATLVCLSGFFRKPWTELFDNLSVRQREFLLQQAGWLLRSAGRLTEAEAALVASRNAAVNTKNWHIAGVSSRNLNQLYEVRGDLKCACRSGRNSLKFAKASQNGNEYIKNLTRLAGTLRLLGRLAGAERCFNRAGIADSGEPVPVSDQSGFQFFLFGDLLVSQGQFEKAIRAAERAIAAATQNKAAPIVTALAYYVKGKRSPVPDLSSRGRGFEQRDAVL